MTLSFVMFMSALRLFLTPRVFAYSFSETTFTFESANSHPEVSRVHFTHSKGGINGFLQSSRRRQWAGKTALWQETWSRLIKTHMTDIRKNVHSNLVHGFMYIVCPLSYSQSSELTHQHQLPSNLDTHCHSNNQLIKLYSHNPKHFSLKRSF